MQTTELTLNAAPTDDIARAIGAILGAARGVLAVRLSTAHASVAVDYDEALTSPGRLQAALRADGVAAAKADGETGGCCGGCCGG